MIFGRGVKGRGICVALTLGLQRVGRPRGRGGPSFFNVASSNAVMFARIRQPNSLLPQLLPLVVDDGFAAAELRLDLLDGLAGHGGGGGPLSSGVRGCFGRAG
jgi:hypothetical protein